MRRLVACSACHRQYDASSKSPGETFGCSCGAAVEVRAGSPHDAAVVRCSACGGTRQEGEPACRWCGSEFTLDERDLNTICPQCLTRIGDRARHCHACGVAVDPQPIGAADPARPCPVCPGAPPLRSRALAADLTLLECARCGGLWIAPGPLRTLVARVSGGVAQASALLGPLARPRPEASGRADPGGPLYRACVVCAQRMNRTRFAGRTPVVVDYCRQHGVWFDDRELAVALEALAQGGVAEGAARHEMLPGDVARAERLTRPERDDRARARAGAWPHLELGHEAGFGHAIASTGLDILGAILRFLR